MISFFYMHMYTPSSSYAHVMTDWRILIVKSVLLIILR